MTLTIHLLSLPDFLPMRKSDFIEKLLGLTLVVDRVRPWLMADVVIKSVSVQSKY